MKPDWSQYEEDSYSITISLEDNSYGNVKILFPQDADEFFANDMVILSVVPKPGYKLVDNSLTYKKQGAMTYSRIRTTFTNRRELNEFVIPAIDAASGTYLITMPNSDIVVSALFELCQYNITYSDVAEDVVNTNPDSYNVNSIIELTDLVREGYNFLGWYDAQGNLVTRIVDRTGDLVLTPKFEIIEENIPDPEKPEDGSGDENKPEGDKSDSEEGKEDGTGEGNKPGTDNGSDEGNKPGTDNDSDEGNKPGTDNGSANENKPSTGNNSVTITGRPSNVVTRPTVGTNGMVAVKPNTNNGQSGSNGNAGSNVQNGIIGNNGANIQNNVQNNIHSSIQSGVQTGDETNVPKLALICTAAVLILLIFAFKRPNDDKDEEE